MHDIRITLHGLPRSGKTIIANRIKYMLQDMHNVQVEMDRSVGNLSRSDLYETLAEPVTVTIRETRPGDAA
jgi:adenylylsulfate kinase-like enzyme